MFLRFAITWPQNTIALAPISGALLLQYELVQYSKRFNVDALLSFTTRATFKQQLIQWLMYSSYGIRVLISSHLPLALTFHIHTATIDAQREGIWQSPRSGHFSIWGQVNRTTLYPTRRWDCRSRSATATALLHSSLGGVAPTAPKETKGREPQQRS